MAHPPWRRLGPIALLLLGLGLTACSDTDPSDDATADPAADASDAVLRVGAIPDQDPEQLARLYDRVAERLASELDVEVEYVPVTDYAASVTLFRTGDLDLVWFGGLTGVQARAQTPGARAVAQRNIDAEFHSVFIANVEAGIDPIGEVDGLSVLAGRRLTFGSESSTSGRLMPEYFLLQAGVGEYDFQGPPGFSGSHDATIDVVEAGSYEVGALNEQVWKSRLEAGDVATDVVQEVFRTPAYFDYHWLLRPDVDDRFGAGFGDRVEDVLLGLDTNVAADAEILELFGAGRFIETSNENYAAIEEVAGQLGLLTE